MIGEGYDFMPATHWTQFPVVLVAIATSSLAAAVGDGAFAAERAAPLATAEPAAAPVTQAASSDAIATEEHEIEGVRVELRAVSRARGDTLNVRWRYTNGSGEEQMLARNGGNAFSPYLLAATTYLIDPVNRKKYLVITDADSTPVTSTTVHMSGRVMIGPGATINSWAKFPAPAADVETIDVIIPGIMPFENIPIGN